MKQLWEVEGMWCPGCARALQKKLGRLPGVTQASVHFQTSLLSLEFDPADFTRGTVEKIAENLGYPIRAFDWSGAARSCEKEESHSLLRLLVAIFTEMWVMMATIPTYQWSPSYPWFPGIERDAALGLAWAAFAMATPALAYCAWPFFCMAWRWLRCGLGGSDLLVSLGVSLSWFVSLARLLRGDPHIYVDGSLFLLACLLASRRLEELARRRNRHDLSALLNHAPTRYRDLENQWKFLADAEENQLFLLESGEPIPLDGVVVEGGGWWDAALLTGESDPRAIGPGDEIFAGTRVTEGALKVRCVARVGDRRIDRLALAALDGRTGVLQELGERAAEWITRALLGFAVLEIFAGLGNPWQALETACSLFVVICPCALTLAVPMVSLRASLEGRRLGIHWRTSRSLESLALCGHLWLDKTGTLTCGQPRLTGVTLRASGWTEEQALRAASQLSRDSLHPLARCLRLLCPEEATPSEHLAGLGIRQNGRLLGRASWLRDLGVRAYESPGSGCELAVDGEWIASFHFRDSLEPAVLEMVSELAAGGYRVGVLSGDQTANLLSLKSLAPWRALIGDLTPEGKRLIVKNQPCAMVGDGLNDLPALGAASVGISVGSCPLATSQAADVHLEKITLLPQALDLAKRARHRMNICLWSSLIYNLALLPAAFWIGFSPSWAAIAMGLSGLSVVFISMRPLLPEKAFLQKA